MSIRFCKKTLKNKLLLFKVKHEANEVVQLIVRRMTIAESWELKEDFKCLIIGVGPLLQEQSLYSTDGGIKACDIAYYGLKYYGTAYNDCYNAGSNNCSDFTREQFTSQSNTISCNQGGNLYPVFESLTDYYGSINIYWCAESGCLKNVTKMREYLSKGRPLYIKRNWSSSGAHAYTVGGYYRSGWSGDYYVIAWDPWVTTQWWLLYMNTEWTDLKVDSLDVGEWGTFWQYGSSLSNGVSNSGSLNQGEWRFYKINVNSGYNKIQVDLTNLSSDLDLYVRKGKIPGMNSGEYDKASGNEGTTSETCTLDNTGTNDWYIGVYGYSTGNFTVKATLRSNNPERESIMNGTHTLSWAYFTGDTGRWYISPTSGAGNVYSLTPIKNHNAGWATVGADAAHIDLKNNVVSIDGNLDSDSSDWYYDIGWKEWVQNNSIHNDRQWIQGKTVSIKWYFFRVESTGVWYIINVPGYGSGFGSGTGSVFVVVSISSFG